ncbi:unnamed protein product [Closterium sp. NIES-65]|nr:unnamed protein product [Closterium sp. NIES-65]
MYALSTSAEGVCHLCVPPYPYIQSAALGAGEAGALGARASPAPGVGEDAALGASASPAPSAGESALSGAVPAAVLHTFTLDSGASRSFFRDRTTLTPLSRPVAVSLADPSGGPVLAHYSTVLPCPAAPSGSLSGLYLPSFSTNLVSGADLQDGGVDQFTPASQRVTHSTCARTGQHLATFTRQPGPSLYTMTTESPSVTASGQVAALGQVSAAASPSNLESAPCSCRLLSHQTLLWHHRLGHPSLPRLQGMASRLLVSCLPRSLPPLPPGPAPTCVPCVEGRQRAAPHSSEFPPTEAPQQTLYMDVWGPTRVRGQGHERYFLLVVNDYSRYTTVFPLCHKGEVIEVLIDWIRAARLQLRESFGSDFPVLRLHSDRGGEISSDLLRAFCRTEGIRQTFTLLASPQQNGMAERRIGMVMDVARTSMIDAAAPHFLWPFAVQYAAHQINLQPRVSMPETSPTLRWTGSWQFYHPTSRRVLSSQDVTFGESVPYYRLFPYRTAPLPPPPLFLAPGTPPVDPLPPQGTAPSRVSLVDAVEPVEVAVDSGAGSGGAEPERVESGGAESGGAEPGRSFRCFVRAGATLSASAARWLARRWRRAAGAGGASGAGGSAAAGGPSAAGAAGGSGATGPRGARTGGAGAARPGGASRAGAAGGAGAGGAAGVGAAGGIGAGAASSSGGPSGARAVGGAGAGGAAGAGAPVGAGFGATGAAGGAAGAVGAGSGGAGAVRAGSGGAARPRPYFVPLLEQVLDLPPSTGPAPPLECPPPVQSESQLQPASPLLAPSPYTGPTGGLAERREPASRPASPVCAARTGRRVPRQRPPAVQGKHQIALRPSTAPLRVPLPSPPESSLPVLADPEFDSLRAASPTVTRLLATVVTDPSFESSAASALVAELVDFAAHSGIDYAASLVAESESVSPLSVGGECALSTDVLEEGEEEFLCFAAALPHLVSMLIAPEGDPDAPDIPSPRSYAEAIEVYGLCQAPREWHDTLRTTLAALGFAPSTADPSLFLSTDTSLPSFYILVYVDDLVFATADIAGLAHVKSELQKRHTCTDLGEMRTYFGLQITRDRARRTITLTQSHMVQQVLQRFGFTYSLPQATPLSTHHSLSALALDESVEPSGPYPELVGCLMYLMTCTRPDLAYPLIILARYVAPGRHRLEHMVATKRVLRYLCSTSGMGLVLGGRSPVVLTGHADASWADDQATQWS